MKKIFVFVLIGLFFASCSNTHKEYREDGTLLFEVEIDDNNLRDGEGKFYYSNGNLEQEGVYKKDKEEGLFKFYYETGELQRIVNYKNGNEEGLVKRYYETGGLEAEINFKGGKQDGQLKGYYRDGTLETIQHFTSNVMKGVFEFYYSNGQLKTEAFYENNDSISYYLKYDNLGVLTDESRNFAINLNSDTIYLGEAVEMEMELNGPIEDSVFVSMNIHYYDEPSKSSNPKMFTLKDNKYHLSFTPDILGEWGYLGFFTIGKEKWREFRIPLTSFYVLEREEEI